jgi:hypothetical protein
MPSFLQSPKRHSTSYYNSPCPLLKGSGDVFYGMTVLGVSPTGGSSPPLSDRIEFARLNDSQREDKSHPTFTKPLPPMAYIHNPRSKLYHYCSGFRGSLHTHIFNFKHKVVPKPVVNPGFLKPFHCKGLFTTTHAKRHRLTNHPLREVLTERRSTHCQSSLPKDGTQGIPARSSSPGLIGVGLASGLRTFLISSQYFNFTNKVVPKSAVNPDSLEPFNCKGLFTTTHAVMQGFLAELKVKAWRKPLAACTGLIGLLVRHNKEARTQPESRFDWRWPGLGFANSFYENQH